MIDTTYNLDDDNIHRNSFGATRYVPKVWGKPTVRYIVEIDGSIPAHSTVLSQMWTANGWADVVRLYGSDPEVEQRIDPQDRRATVENVRKYLAGITETIIAVMFR